METRKKKYLAWRRQLNTIGNLIGVKIDIGMWRKKRQKKPQNDGKLPGVSVAN